jgi:hypothetical protein
MANEQTSVPLYAAAEVLTAANMNISAGTGVPVFATTVTRDAAFGGAGEKVLAEGQLCYLSASNIVQYYDGAAWATVGPASAGGLVPIVPTSVTLGGGSATTSANGRVAYTSATTSILLNGVFSSAYTNYKVICSNTSDGATAGVTCRLSVGGTPSTATEYRVNWVYGVISTAYAENLAAASSWSMWINNTKLQNQTFDVINPFLTKQTSLLGICSQSAANGASGASMAMAHMNQAATSYDGIQFLVTDASTGTISVYGYNQ